MSQDEIAKLNAPTKIKYRPESSEPSPLEEPVCDEDPYRRYVPGVYDVRCTDMKTYVDPRYKRRIALLKFSLFPEGGTVCAFFNLGPANKPPHAGRGSKYRRAWMIANGA